MQNPDIARVFDEVADLLEIQDANPFRVRAYRNAARTIRDFPEPIAELVRSRTKDLTEIPGIGADLADKITAIVTTGELPLRKQLAAKLPPGLLDLLRIPGLGPKRVKLLHKKLKVKSATDLAAALAKHRIQKLKGFGPKIEEKIRTGLGVAEQSERRLLLHEAETAAHAIVAYLTASGARSLRSKGTSSTSTACSRAPAAWPARPRRRSTPGSASTGCHPSCAKHAARSPSPASTGSPGWSSSRTSAATSRCTRARRTARRRSTRWPKRRGPSSTNTWPSPTTRSA